jgi:transposase InsO family protein
MHCRAVDDMVILAHIREQHCLSLQSYGRPRMTEELQELGLKVGHRRVGRLMGENGIKIIRTQKYKATTDSNHTFNIAPNLLDQDFSATGPNQKWAGDIGFVAQIGLRSYFPLNRTDLAYGLCLGDAKRCEAV